jgi:predicted PurR-regulated permease PerM
VSDDHHSDSEEASPREGRSARLISPRDVWTVLWVTLLVLLSLRLVLELRRVLIWLFVAAFIAAVLAPVVTWLTRRGARRGLAVAVVVITFLVAGVGIAYLFVQPLVVEATEFSEDLPKLVDELRSAPLVRQLINRFDIQTRIEQTSADLPRRLLGWSGPLLSAFKTVGEFLVAALTVFVLAIFLLLYGPPFVTAGLGLIRDPERRAYVQGVGRDVLRAVTGWVAGNLLTSLIAATISLVVFAFAGLPYNVLLALWVGFADLIPLAGATLGAIPAIVIAFIQSVPVGIGITVYFVVYQQLENHLLQPYVYGRTIRLNPFVVLVSILIGVELAGFLGALFALPVAGAVQVIVGRIHAGRAPPPAIPNKG